MVQCEKVLSHKAAWDLGIILDGHFTQKIIQLMETTCKSNCKEQFDTNFALIWQ